MLCLPHPRLVGWMGGWVVMRLMLVQLLDKTYKLAEGDLVAFLIKGHRLSVLK